MSYPVSGVDNHDVGWFQPYTPFQLRGVVQGGLGGCPRYFDVWAHLTNLTSLPPFRFSHTFASHSHPF
jgi:hypothetical protein